MNKQEITDFLSFNKSMDLSDVYVIANSDTCDQSFNFYVRDIEKGDVFELLKVWKGTGWDNKPTIFCTVFNNELGRHDNIPFDKMDIISHAEVKLHKRVKELSDTISRTNVFLDSLKTNPESIKRAFLDGTLKLISVDDYRKVVDYITVRNAENCEV